MAVIHSKFVNMFGHTSITSHEHELMRLNHEQHHHWRINQTREGDPENRHVYISAHRHCHGRGVHCGLGLAEAQRLIPNSDCRNRSVYTALAWREDKLAFTMASPSVY